MQVKLASNTRTPVLLENSLKSLKKNCHFYMTSVLGLDRVPGWQTSLTQQIHKIFGWAPHNIKSTAQGVVYAHVVAWKMASSRGSPLQSRSPTGSPVKKKRKIIAQPCSNPHLMNLKIFEDAERSDMRVSEEDGGEICDKELWFFQLPKNVSLTPRPKGGWDLEPWSPPHRQTYLPLRIPQMVSL